MNGNSECNTIAASLGEYVAQANQLGPKIGSRPEVLCIHRIKRKKLSYWLCHDDNTKNTDVTTAITIIVLKHLEKPAVIG